MSTATSSRATSVGRWFTWAYARNHRGTRSTSTRRRADLVDLLVGSEGTLAIIVGIQLKLAPVPAATSSVLGSFPSLETATAAASKAVEAGASACELLDRTFLSFAASGIGSDEKLRSRIEGSAAILLAEVEGYSSDSAAAAAQQLAQAFRGAGRAR